MEDALQGEPIAVFKPVKGTIGVYVNPENGKLATSDCPIQRLTYFVAGTEPTEYCTDHLLHEEESIDQIEEKEEVPWYKKIFNWSI
jgi:membrane carboxypeptidase/penicillin-binding protein